MSKKILSVIFALCMLVTCTPFSGVAFAEESSTAQSAESKRQEIKNKLDSIDKKLASLGSQSKETEEYIEALNEKISYLSEQYKIAENETEKIENSVGELEKNISLNEKEIENIKAETVSLEENLKVLNEQFSQTYAAYRKRIRAVYESGEQIGTLAFLLESNGIQNLLTRYEMVRAVSKRDGELLKSVEEQTKKISSAQDALNKKKTDLAETQKKYKSNEQNLKAQKTVLVEKQADLTKQQSEIESQQVTANNLLKNLNDKTKEYGEYRDITQSELDEIDDEIAEADRKYAMEEAEKAKKKAQEESKKKKEDKSGDKSENQTSSKDKDSSTEKNSDDKNNKGEEKSTTADDSSSEYISLTYPCPKYTKITCAFGAYSGHTGCDFSTGGHENQTIVAAESGTVILVKLLERSYGHYIVIRHDKKTRSGKTVYTLYAHNNDIVVSEGDYVTKGQKIANSGTTGNSTGPHCHFEVRVGGSSQRYAVNPASYLP